MQTTVALDTALNKEQVEFFIAVRADLPTRTVRLLDGSGEATWSEGTFTGSDGVFGTLGNIDAIQDGVDEHAPALSITFLPNELADVAELASPAHQNSRLRLWLGAVDLATRGIVDAPYCLFDGVLDVPTLQSGFGTRSVEFSVASSFEKLFADDEGNRLNPANHKDVWPGETGLDAITGIVRQVIWGPGDKISGGAPGGVISGPTTGPNVNPTGPTTGWTGGGGVGAPPFAPYPDNTSTQYNNPSYLATNKA